MSLVDCQLSLDVIGYEDLNVISSFLSVFLSQLNSHSLLVKLSVISHFCPCQFCLSLSISRLHVMNTELMIGGFHSEGDAYKHSFKRVSMGWCLLRLLAKILALLRLSVNFFQLRLTKKLKINLFCFKKLNIN